jgi:hypothetical protein
MLSWSLRKKNVIASYVLAPKAPISVLKQIESIGLIEHEGIETSEEASLLVLSERSFIRARVTSGNQSWNHDEVHKKISSDPIFAIENPT